MAARQELAYASAAGAAPLGTQVAGAPVTIAVGASPFTYTNVTPNVQHVRIITPASTTLTAAKRGVTIVDHLTPAATRMSDGVLLGPGEALVVTYTNAPTMWADTP